MKKPVAALLLALVSAVAASAGNPAPRQRQNFDAGWRFAFGNPCDPAKDFDHGTGYFSYLAKAGYGDGPADPKFDASAWRRLDLPHDWAAEAPFDPRASPSHGFKAVGRGFPERSVGWYRKQFAVPAADQGRRFSLEFDGVQRDAQVWINGFYLGREPSGSESFAYDLTAYLNYGGDNVVAVRADVTLEEGWYYEGAGIYRHVWLTRTEPLHVARWGVFVTAALSGDFSAAEVTARAAVCNDGTVPAAFTLEQSVLSPDGRVLGTRALPGLRLAAAESGEFSVTLPIVRPRLWSTENPALHRLVTIVRDAAGAEVDRCETPFGIRSARFDPDRGFFLNGRRLELKGAAVHQDHAGVGTAVPDALWEYRLRRLQAFGCNAIRTAHQPPAPALLEACDRLGMLVIDENRSMGLSPPQLGPLEAMVRRDRNHPSVILWSVGNEEWRIEGNARGARVTAAMQAFVRRLDPTRRSVVAISGGWGGSSTTTDVVGYNYISQSDPDAQHARFPLQPGVGTEETTTQGTRGTYFDDRPRARLAPLAKGDTGSNCEVGWRYYAARPFLAGLFFWTGFDYRGEPTPLGWPAISSQYGILDTCGFPKDSFYYLKSWWTDEPVLHLFPHWNWPGREGQTLTVGCYSNFEAVELVLNGVSLGRKAMPRNGHLEWRVAYRPGVLEARGYRDGRVAETVREETTGAPVRLGLSADRPAVRSDGSDVAVVAVRAFDAQDRAVPTADAEVRFAVSGGRILGVGNGDPGSHEPDDGQARRLFNGLAQVIVQAPRAPGAIVLRAEADGLEGASITIPAPPMNSTP